MKKFVLKYIYFSLIFLAILISILIIPSYFLFNKNYERGHYYSNLLYIQENANYDLLYLGSSHAKTFEICRTWQLTERILNRKSLNISDFGGGVLNQKLFLNYFYSSGNNSQTILYFIDPHMIVSDRFDNVGVLDKEPFKLDFFVSLVKSDFSNSEILSYLKSKIKLPHYWVQTFSCDKRYSEVLKIDSLEIKNRAYYLVKTDIINNDMLLKQTSVIRETINMVERNNGNLIFIIPPTLFENLLGYEELINFLEEIKKDKGINYYDFHSSMKEFKYYLDYDHLNEVGVEYFLSNYMNKLID